jgi:hypothetical protein
MDINWVCTNSSLIFEICVQYNTVLWHTPRAGSTWQRRQAVRLLNSPYMPCYYFFIYPHVCSSRFIPEHTYPVISVTAIQYIGPDCLSPLSGTTCTRSVPQNCVILNTNFKYKTTVCTDSVNVICQYGKIIYFNNIIYRFIINLM